LPATAFVTASSDKIKARIAHVVALGVIDGLEPIKV
jgi:hypothetical protein